MEPLQYKISFNSRPISLFPSYRPMLRIAQILLVLKINSNGGKASLLKLHLFSWGFKSINNLQKIKDFVISDFQDNIMYFGIEPTLNRALSLAIGEGLVAPSGQKYSITEKGEKLVSSIISDNEVFVEEKPILNFIGKKINESKITQLENKWKNAKN